MFNAPKKQRETGVFREVWKAYNDLLDFCRSIAVMPSGARGVRVSRTINGTLLATEAIEAVSGGGRVVRMRVDTVRDDYLSCTNRETGEAVYVAKPFNLRSDNWNNASIVYTIEPYPQAPASLTISYAMQTPTYRIATVGTFEEHQVIRPQYVPGFSEIFASECESTGVAGVEWVDLNADGRAWTMVA